MRTREGNSGVQDNLFNYAAGARVSEHLETTQLNKFGTKGVRALQLKMPMP